MPHLIVLDDKILCILMQLAALKSAYDRLKTYRDENTLPPFQQQQINNALHSAEDLAEAVCGDLETATGEMENLLP